MAYKNKSGQPRERAMVAAYSLVTQFGGKQQDVAKVLGCSPSTVHQWVKEIGFKKEIAGLKQELSDANEYIEELAENLGLEYHSDDQED
ncbi:MULTISPECIES: helix-turn-helix domain-containing protein [Enterobacteriaceae]|uniref:helix-turn-helix domain-containing protein n=1 Tax=Enterobacteriaceae TaxID=543 RepID=UPI001CD389CD|nr:MULTISPECIES: helix-turn-helix domain-containing protein [Klebsiella]MCH9428303.1 helix-turn-helix domain-containing protein [Klebsiella quasipneumoniae]MCP6335617.1 helix-turn-helix domain-containing protein [Klebsiella pneumoniae]MCP6379285.1 helix-turn-helix domain-containing protein [Klebsiella pneumoniae]MCP6473307.1 helix-turn-helix domain-containing protein [Klebsiella pneumoniae]MCS5780282.1 helix-turn-helix domain-containing protein [Klebsiella pneumoniae subsp. pneumoniae]